MLLCEFSTCKRCEKCGRYVIIMSERIYLKLNEFYGFKLSNLTVNKKNINVNAEHKL